MKRIVFILFVIVLTNGCACIKNQFDGTEVEPQQWDLPTPNPWQHENNP